MNYLLVLLASMTPLIEFRFAIPFGVSLGVSLWESVLIATLGAVIAAKLVLWFLPLIVSFARKRSKWLDTKLIHIFEKADAAHSKKMRQVGSFGIAFFVMLPIPGSGVYTAALLAYLFSWPFWKSWFSISAGAFFGSLLIGFLTASGVGLWQYVQSFF